jgi:acyl-CoA synthetase (AMP-forming)/AMP-acid ligase II
VSDNSVDFSNANMVDCLRHFAALRPDHPAMEDGDRTISYFDLNRRTDEAAVNIRDAGIAVGEVVAVALPDSIEHLIVNCGLLRAGAVLFSIDPNFPIGDVQKAIEGAKAKTLIGKSSLSKISDVRFIDRSEICASNGQSFPTAGATGDQNAMLFQSSGTTGKAKSFFITHAQNQHRCARITNRQAFTGTDRFMILAAMYFPVSRIYFFVLLANGATLVLTPGQSPEKIEAFVNRKNISFLKVMPANLIALLDYGKGKNLLFPDLRAMSSGSAPISNQQRVTACRCLTPRFYESYGTNELGNVAFASPEDQDSYPDSVGRIDEIVVVEIVGEDDRVLPPGEVGQIRLRCAGMITGYIDNPEMNARHFRNGWFYPGDVAKLNQQRYLFLLGRSDDVINNAGVKFYPIELETVLLSHPRIKEAAVFPWPHDTAGQVAAAAVVADGNVSTQELRAFCLDRLPGYKQPFALALMSNLPKNAMGKILKKNLKAQFEAKANTQGKTRPPTIPALLRQ